jgi:hypothetical protein
MAWQVNVCFGSKADIAASPTNVRFTPKSGHWNSVAACPLCAKSGREQVQQEASIRLPHPRGQVAELER